MARGFIPVRLRSSRKTLKHGVTDETLGPLRSPTGINPLATGVPEPQGAPVSYYVDGVFMGFVSAVQVDNELPIQKLSVS